MLLIQRGHLYSVIKDIIYFCNITPAGGGGMSCGKNKFEASLFASIENVFDCSVCGNKFKADITITPTLLTEPVSSINKTFNELLEQKER